MKITSLFIVLILTLSVLTQAAYAARETKITADDAAAGDMFGISVSISGDYAVIGAHGNDDDGGESGSAYIFTRDGDDWNQQAKLTADDGAAADVFGFSVSIDGDYAVIGAYIDHNQAGSTGSAYIFIRDGEDWTQQAKLTANDAAADDYFGHSASISGDYAVIGAYLDDDDGGSSGSSYIFFREGGRWTQQAKLTADDAAAGDSFGNSVSISGDYAVIGGKGNDDDGGESGSAYIFTRDGNEWTQQAKLTANDAAERDQFGISVSISGDYAVIGAYTDDDDGGSSGSAYIFTRDGNEWTQQAKLTANDAAANDNFGNFVSISGDYAVIGACLDDDDGGESGSAYIFTRDGYDWNQQAKLTADDAAEGDRFGFSVSIDGDYAIVGAFWNDDDGENSGSAYIYQLPVLEPNEQTLSLLRGWNLTSLNLNPIPAFYDPDDDRGPDVIRMFEQLRIDDNQHRIFLVKNQAGRFYAPHVGEDGFNNIPFWNLGEGYWIRVTEDCEAIWEGEPIPADEDIWLDWGWNMIAYFPTYDLPMDSPDFYAIEPILDNVVLMKDARGRFARPDVPFSNMPPLTAGQGYQIRVDEDVVLNYPEEIHEEHPPLIPPYFAVGEARTLIPPNPPYTRGEKQSAPPLRSRGGIKGGVLPMPVNTGHNMSVLVTSVTGVEVNAGDQIAAFNFEGMLVGVGQFNNAGICGLAVWGDDPSTDKIDGLSAGETFDLRMWDADRAIATDLHVTDIQQGALNYETDGFVMLGVEVEPLVPVEYYLSQNYPNPFNNITNLKYGLPAASQVSIQVYDLSGRLVETLIDKKQSAGNHFVIWDGRNASSGVYIVRMNTAEFTNVQKLILLR